MTQLIGVICEHGKQAIAMSDRMISSADMTITFEPDKPKYELITKKCVALTGGTLLEPELIETVKAQVKEGQTIKEIAEVCKQEFQSLREKRVEEEILRPSLFNSVADYHEKLKMLPEVLVMTLNDRIRKYELDYLIMLIGLDEKGAHLYVITDPGIEACHDSVAFCCPGMGRQHTDPLFALFRYSSSASFKEALYIAYEAKKRAELAGGVGKTTDTLLLSRDGVKEVLPETFESLNEVRYEQERGVWRDYITSRIDKLEIKTRNV